MSTETPTPLATLDDPREPLAEEMREILAWVYAHEHRGEFVSERLDDLMRRFELRAWRRGHDNLPLDDEET